MYFVASFLHLFYKLRIVCGLVDYCPPKSKEKKYGAIGFGLWRRGCKFC